MSTIGEFNSYNLGSIKDEESGQVALYHYLRNFYHEESPLTPQLINNFFADALQLPHWQEKSLELYQNVLEVLTKFYGLAAHTSPAGGGRFTFSQILNLEKAQLILISSPEDLYSIITHHETSLSKEGEDLRILMSDKFSAVVIKRFINGDMIVKTFTNLVRVQGHALVPLTPSQEIHYDSNLELRMGATQILKTAPHSRVHFRVKTDCVSAQFISGFAFRLNQEVVLSSLAKEPRIFYPLKRLERYYINRATDPYYIEVISTLDTALQMIRSRTAQALEFARNAFEGAQITFDQIYPDDKALYSRLRELAKHISAQPKIANQARPFEQNL